MTHTSATGDRGGEVPPVRRRDPKATRDRLVRSALELFTTLGYYATTTPLIAQRSGVAEGTIYRHFESKEHLLNEIYRAGLRLFLGAIKDSPATHPCRERLYRIALAWRDVAARNPAIVRLVFVDRLGALLDQKSRDGAKELRTELEKIIAGGKSAGQVRPGAVEVWADIWLRLTILMLERVGAKEWGPDQPAVQTVLESAWSVIGLSGAPASPSLPGGNLPAGPPPPPQAQPPGDTPHSPTGR
ncbi:MAG TPA: TetR/AcrR family transcriptional regulator [Gemmatimonadales bacterium]|nr:TetR/AcrR family transcriptional regulator [Gemmatimonadales bacterium]